MSFQVTGQRHWHHQNRLASAGVRPQADATSTVSGNDNDRCRANTSAQETTSGSEVPANIQEMLAQLKQLLEALLGQTSPASGTGNTTETENAASTETTNTTNSSSLADAAIQQNRTANATQKARLNKVLQEVANDSEGAKLLQAAVAKGYTFTVGNPGAGANGETSTDQKRIVVNPNAPDFEKTLVHELVHAATDGDGDSKDEEGKADVIGFRVASRILGKGEPNEQQVYNAKISNPAYASLSRNNNVDTSLRALGLIAFA